MIAEESASEAGYRRLAAWPPGIVAGVLVGAVAATRWHARPLAAVVAGLLAAFLATRVRDGLEARARAALADDPRDALLILGFDLALGAVAGLVAAPLLDASVLSAIGSGAALAGLWSFVIGGVLRGSSFVDRAVDFLLAGNQSEEFAREPIVADAEALERAGHVEGALRKYHEVIERRPREPEAYLRAAALLRRENRPAEAADLLRAARRRARLASGHQVIIGRELADLAAGPLADPTAAAAELALLAAGYRGTPAGDAAALDADALRGLKPG